MKFFIENSICCQMIICLNISIGLRMLNVKKGTGFPLFIDVK